MNQQRILTAPVAPPVTGSPSIEIDCSLSSEVAAISPFVDKFVLMLTKFRCIPGREGDVEIALREALNNAVVHGNHQDQRKWVRVTCRCESGQVAINVRDEGPGFDFNKLPDPTTTEAIHSTHGRGIYLMRAFMDEVRFEEGGSLVYMRKCAL